MNLNMGMCTGVATNAINTQGLTEIYLPPMKLKGVRSPRATGRPNSSIHLVAEPAPRSHTSPRGLGEKRFMAPEGIATLKKLEVELAGARNGVDARGSSDTTSSSSSSSSSSGPDEEPVAYDPLRVMCPGYARGEGFPSVTNMLCGGCRPARDVSVEGLYDGRRGDVRVAKAPHKSGKVSHRPNDEQTGAKIEEGPAGTTRGPFAACCNAPGRTGGDLYGFQTDAPKKGGNEWAMCSGFRTAEEEDVATGRQSTAPPLVTPYGIVTYSSRDAQPSARSVTGRSMPGNEDENSCDDEVNRQVTEEYSRRQEPYNRVGIHLPEEERGENCSISSSVALAVDEVNRQIRSESPLKGMCGGPCLQSKHDDYQTTVQLVPEVHRGRDMRDEGLLSDDNHVTSGSTGLRCCEPEFVRVPPEMERKGSSRLLQAISPRNMCSNVFDDIQNKDFTAEYDVPIPA